MSPYMLCPAPVRPRLRARLLVPGALAAFAGALILLAVLHVDRRLAPLDPVSTMLSDYALSPGRWLWDSALLLTSTGSALLLVALYRRGLLANPALVAAKALWCVSLLAVVVFAKDPQGGAITATGKIHLYASAVTCLSLPVVGWAMGRRHRDDPRWRRFATWSRRLALAAIPFYLPFIVPFAVNVVFGGHLPTVATGLVERLMMLLEIALLGVLGHWAHRAMPAGVRFRPRPQSAPA
ncbi:DUF998 domain-containing protein [Amycolatopsis kentuckyensis]|uniref:DUF998 domain-containing protein n=1 Tax=Amycolatopsis kentuckyensis TaxID=218823 RepID=UPI001FC913F6|nr:DUF998 domain-containing protein [Amycolatopsis kentuckyensis]